jgi:hypothetical protein
MGGSESSRNKSKKERSYSERKKEYKKRRRSDADDFSSESSHKRKKQKNRHKDYKKKSKKRSKHASRKHKKRFDTSVENDEDVSFLPSNGPLPTTEDNTIKRNELTNQHQEEQLRKHARRMTPMSREEYQAQQSTIREVYDEQTGRYRLVRGTGEIIESLVSRSQHENINRQATREDGASFSRDAYRAAHR